MCIPRCAVCCHLAKLSSLAKLKVGIVTTSVATSDDNLKVSAPCTFQCEISKHVNCLTMDNSEAAPTTTVGINLHRQYTELSNTISINSVAMVANVGGIFSREKKPSISFAQDQYSVRWVEGKPNKSSCLQTGQRQCFSD